MSAAYAYSSDDDSLETASVRLDTASDVQADSPGNVALPVGSLAGKTDEAFVPADGDNNTAVWAKGNEAYDVGDFKSALGNYMLLVERGLSSPQLYYNIGNANYRLGMIGKAVLYYEKALMLDPTYSDAKANLNFVRMQTVDKIDAVPEFVAATWIRQLKNTLSSNSWAVMSLVFLVAALALLLLFRFAASVRTRKLFFISACLSFLLLAVSFIFALNLALKAGSSSSAIVVERIGNVKSAPNTTGNSIFVLHEGTKVKVLEVARGWNRIEISDGRQGWIRSSDIETI